jgi:hypothetical protein
MVAAIRPAATASGIRKTVPVIHPVMIHPATNQRPVRRTLQPTGGCTGIHKRETFRLTDRVSSKQIIKHTMLYGFVDFEEESGPFSVEG